MKDYIFQILWQNACMRPVRTNNWCGERVNKTTTGSQLSLERLALLSMQYTQMSL